jgi:hypothetical protein
LGAGSASGSGSSPMSKYCSRDSMLPSVMTSATVACNKFNVLDKFNLVRQSLTKTTTKKRQLVSLGREKEGTKVYYTSCYYYTFLWRGGVYDVNFYMDGFNVLICSLCKKMAKKFQ